MPKLADLPAELFETILDRFGEDCKVREFYPTILVNKRWHKACLPRLYGRKWDYNGDEHSVKSLWLYLKKMYENKALAARIEVVDIRYWHVSALSKPHDGTFKLTLQDLKSVLRMERLARARWSKHPSSKVKERFDEDVRDPSAELFMAILMTLLPNIRSLKAVLGYVDAYLADILRIPFFKDPHNIAFERVEEVEIIHWGNFGETNILTGGPSSQQAVYLGEFLSLPAIRELSLYDVGITWENIAQETAGLSSITHLTIFESDGTAYFDGAIPGLLRLPHGLVSVTIRVNDPGEAGYLIGDDRHDALWTSISLHRNTLRHLDYYCRLFNHEIENTEDSSQWTPRPICLRHFPKLDHLCINPETLIGFFAPDGIPWHALRDALPPNLKTFCLYDQLNGYHTLDELCRQTIDVIANKDMCALDRLLIEDQFFKNGASSEQDLSLREMVEGAALKSGLSLEIVPSCDIWEKNQIMKCRPNSKNCSSLRRDQEPITAREKRRMLLSANEEQQS